MNPGDIAARETEVVDDFSVVTDWMDKYAYLIDMGKALEPLDDEYKQEAFGVKGCQSMVWLRAWLDEEYVFFAADSDALITKGLIALLIRVLSGQPAESIVGADLGFLDEIGLRNHLSANRSNGLSAMITKMKSHAAVLGDVKHSPA